MKEKIFKTTMETLIIDGQNITAAAILQKMSNVPNRIITGNDVIENIEKMHDHGFYEYKIQGHIFVDHPNEMPQLSGISENQDKTLSFKEVLENLQKPLQKNNITLALDPSTNTVIRLEKQA